MSEFHWAARYINKPWRAGAKGPREFSCWGLTQTCCMVRLKVKMPDIATDTDENQFSAIFDAVREGGWKIVDGAPREDDVVLMRNHDGRRHCGYMVRNGRRLGVLHADGHDTPRGPVGSVIFQSLEEATAGGYSDHEFWRHE